MFIKKTSIFLLLFLIIASCAKENTRPEYFFTAQINNINWIGLKSYSIGQLDYNHDANAHFLTIRSKADGISEDGVRYQFSIMINKPVSKGKFYFNNNGMIVDAIGGVSGAVIGWRRDGVNDYFVSYSINGNVEISHLTKENVSGVFEFTAVIDKVYGESGNDTISVKSGKFSVPIAGISGKAWDGPK